MKNWFEVFFNDAKILDYFENRQIPKIDWFLQHLQLENVQGLKVFDQCCGTGDVSNVFYQAGAQVSGCDISKKTLEILHQKYPFFINHVQANAQIYEPSEKQDVVLNFFSSFGYYDVDEENEKLIGQCSRMLNDQGVFLFELMDFEWLIENHQSRLTYKNVVRESYLSDGFIYQKWIKEGQNIGETKIKIYPQENLERILKKYFNTISNYKSQGRQVFICRKYVLKI